jgi:hypothetical protein
LIDRDEISTVGRGVLLTPLRGFAAQKIIFVT